MARDSYRIPDSLDKNVLDMEISLKSENGVGPKPMSIRIILLYIASIFILAWILTQTFVRDFGIPLIILFTVIWTIGTVMLLQRDKTGHIKASYIPTMISYLPSKCRLLLTRNNEPVNDFYQITGLKNINTENGLIEFEDGTFAFAYEVVGTGSMLLFKSDREAVLDHVEAFYRRMRTEFELIFLTTKEAQKVTRQLAAMDQRIAIQQDPELKELLEYQRDFLKEQIGTCYRTIHQYMLIKADNREALLLGKNILENEVASSSLMFKQVTALLDDDLCEIFRKVYQGRESV